MALRDLATRKRFVKFSNATGWPLSNAMLGLRHQWVGRPREAVLGLPSRNCTPRRGVGSAFRARRLMSFHPGLKHPTSQSGSTELAEVVRLSSRRSPTSRLAFWRHLPQHEGRHSFSDGGLGYSVRPLCGRKKTSKLQCQDFLDDADLLALAYLPMTEGRISRDRCA